jgi:hypothetical protein
MMEIGRVEVSGFRGQEPFRHFEPSLSQTCDALACHSRVRICCRDNHTAYIGFEDRLNAWRCSSMMGTWFEGDVQGRSDCGVAGGRKRQNLGMVLSGSNVCPLTDHVARDVNKDSAYSGVGMGPLLLRQLEGASHVTLVCHLVSCPAVPLMKSGHSRSYVEDENAANDVQTRRIRDMISRTGH